MNSNYLITLNSIGQGLAHIGKPLCPQQSEVIAQVLAKADLPPHERLLSTIDAQMAIIDAGRARRLERRLQNVPVEFERRSGVDRRANRRSGEGELFGLNVIIDDTLPPGTAVVRSGDSAVLVSAIATAPLATAPLEPGSDYDGPSDREIAQRLGERMGQLP